jgi:hypothetical protein
MNTVPRFLRTFVVFLLGFGSMAWAVEPGSRAEEELRGPWAFVPDPTLPNVLLLGDSISIGYTLRVRELLRGRANVFRPLSADDSKPFNCEGTRLGLRHLEKWIEGRQWTVIHFNWGLHDLKQVKRAGAEAGAPWVPQSDLATYGANLRQLTERLKATGARLVFATTTPVPEGAVNPPRDPSDPPRYNAAALDRLRGLGVTVNDLHAFVLPRLSEYQLPRNVHFNAVGNEALAREVAAVIERELSAAAAL